MKLFSGILGLALASAVALATAKAACLSSSPAVASSPGDGMAVDWCGPYAGVHVGGDWGNLKTDDVFGLNTGTPGAFTNFAGVFGGAQFGYNFQRGSLVFGPEVDLGGIGSSQSQAHPPLFADSVDSGFYADVTGRVGLVVGLGLLYTKGGYIYTSSSESHFDAGANPTSSATSGLNGWTLGGGYEYRLNPAWSVKGEYMHSDFGINHLADSSPLCPAPACYVKDGLVIDTVKIGVNYFVNSAYLPLK